MSEGSAVLSRQWVPMVGGSCDIRMGFNALDQAAKVFAGSVGRPRRCLVVLRKRQDLVFCDELRRQVVDAGFEAVWHELGSDGVRTLEAGSQLAAAFAEQGITSDDLCLAVGDADVLSVASHVCGTWCGGTSLACMPTDEVAFLEGALTPRSLDVGRRERLVGVPAVSKHVLLDLDIMLGDLDAPSSRHARALMASAAMASSERDFSTLWDRVDAIMDGDEQAYVDQLMATAKARGKVSASTAMAVRQSLAYGRDFAYALEGLTGPTPDRAALLAEGMRFAGRLAVAMGKLSVDDMLAQEDLLEALDLGTAEADVDPAELSCAIKAERFRTSNRFMLLVPFSLGRVRLATVEDSMLDEHAAAWCAVHATA